jgi:hypothetical protein
MQKLKQFLAILGLITFISQPVDAASQYSVDEMASCVPVGDLAMKMVSLRDRGYEWEIIKTSVAEHIRRDLIIWVTPIATLVMSAPAESSEKIVKQAIRYCLRANKWHKKSKKVLSI